MPDSSPPSAGVAAATAAVMAAFAANSVLMRLALADVVGAPTGVALGEAAIVTLFRLYAGALTLVGILALRGRRYADVTVDVGAGALLFVYATAFSVAYLDLATGTGALILFAAVQATMIGAGLRAGERLGALQWAGLAVAVVGVIVLVSPGVQAPEPLPAATMAVSGVAWGLYSLRGRGVAHPVLATTLAFVTASVIGLGLGLATLAIPETPDATLHSADIGYAIASGALTSALGYVAWYAVLPRLRATSASVVQLSVPVLAAVGGVIWLAEPVTLRLAAASVLTLGGIAAVVRAR